MAAPWDFAAIAQVSRKGNESKIGVSSRQRGPINTIDAQ
jgi:hypothetical protein